MTASGHGQPVRIVVLVTLVVTRTADGSLKVGYTDGPINVSIGPTTGSFVDEQAETPVADAPEAPSASDASTQTETAAAAPSAEQAPFTCPECGATFGGPGTCSNQHPPAEVQPTDQVHAGETASPSSPSPSGDAGTADEPTTGDTPASADSSAAPAWPDAGNADTA